MVKVVQRGRIRVYVHDEREHRHHLPHCHVYWPDGAYVVDLEDRRLLIGNEPPAIAWMILEDHWDELHRAWAQLNQERPSE